MLLNHCMMKRRQMMGIEQERIAIVNGFRTPFTKAGSLLKSLDADQLGVYHFNFGKSVLYSVGFYALT